MKPEHLAAWRAEITQDPAQIGYSGRSHEEIEKLLKTAERDVPNDSEISVSQMLDLMDPQEFIGVVSMVPPNQAEQKYKALHIVLCMHSFRPTSATLKTILEFVFGANSKTVKNFEPKKKRKGLRHEELSLPLPSTSDIADALR